MLKVNEEIEKAGNGVMVVIFNANEGLFGDFDPDNRGDRNLLRFSVYINEDRNADPEDGGWEEKDSWCTDLSADLEPEMITRALDIIYNKMNEALKDDINASIRRIGDELSWLGDGDLCDK